MISKTKKPLSKIWNRTLYKNYANYKIDVNEYDKIILYPYFSSQFKFINMHACIFTIGMDSGPMLYLRGFLNHRKLVYKMFCLINYLQALKIDKYASSISKAVYTVGESDAEFYRAAFLANAKFVSHPVSKLINEYIPEPWSNKKKLALCFPGGMSEFYVSDLLDQILLLLIDNAFYYKDKISISFLGKIKYKSLARNLKLLEASGISIQHEDYAENFEEYLSKQNIILLPLTVGAGTKNKCLSAMGMGLDVIGTPIAVENVFGIKKENVASNALEFIDRINLRIDTGRLYGLSENEITAFKSQHSIENWSRYFWTDIYSEI